MRLNPLITYLKAQCPIFNDRIEHAQSMNALDDKEIETDLPILFVHPSKEQASQNNLINAHRQEVSNAVAFLIVAENSTDSAEPIEDARDQLKAALAKHPDAIDFAEGEILSITGRALWWGDKHTYNTYIRQV